MKKGFLAKLAAVALLSATIGMNHVSALSNAEITWEGNSIYNKNTTIYQDIVVSNVSGNINVVGSGVSVEDETCLTFDHIEKINNNVDFYDKKFMFYTYGEGLNSNTSLVRIYFKTNDKSCSTNILMNRPTISFTDNTSVVPGEISKSIEVKDDAKVLKVTNSNKIEKTSLATRMFIIKFSKIFNKLGR